MPALAIPGTQSPGYAYLTYGDSYIRHSTRIRWVTGTDLYDTTARLADLSDWAFALKDVMPITFAIDGWGITTPTGFLINSGNFSGPFDGLRTTASGQRAYESTTLTITGSSRSVSPGVAGGNAIHRWFIRDGYIILPREKYKSTADEVSLEDYAQFLQNHDTLWADFYGLKAGADQFVKIHFHSATQKSDGM